ncbi:MAG: two pore domain potassium channel family protein [Bdellovibrionales bacterium]|nr:two pore domain potassium channel family protein [Bdellovibrionales bacterium]
MIGIGEVFFRYESPINDAVTSRWDAMWWALATVSTVGYGDIVPATPQGRLCGFALIIVGITFFLSYMAVLVSVINSQVAEETTHIVASKSDLSEILRRLENIESRLKEK